MRKLSALCFLLLISSFAITAKADQTFSDSAVWLSSLTGSDFLTSDYSSLDSLGIADEVVGPLAQTWGNVDFIDSGNPQGGELGFPVVGREGADTIGIVFPPNVCTVLNVDPAAGVLEGFGFNYQVFDAATVAIFDENGIQLGAPFDLNVSTGPDLDFFGWTNCSGTVVSRIEVCGISPFNVFVGGEFSFNPVASDPTCQDQLQSVIDTLNVIRSSASADDQYWIDWAIADLTCAQDSVYWETEDRLSDYGTGFFELVFWATYDLECVADESLVLSSLDAIQELLGCVVENEIEFAQSNGSNSNLIAYAEFFEYYADAYSNAGLYLHAVILHFYAWLFANAA